jgi:hypothetical protein
VFQKRGRCRFYACLGMFVVLVCSWKGRLRSKLLYAEGRPSVEKFVYDCGKHVKDHVVLVNRLAEHGFKFV